MVYRVYDGAELVQVTSSSVIAYVVAEQLREPRVENECGINVLHPSSRREE